MVLCLSPRSLHLRGACTLALVLLATFAHIIRADEIHPGLALLEEKCLGCHNPDKKTSGLDLTTRASALEGGKSGLVLVPGDAEKSRIYELVRDGVMPDGNPLRSRDAQLIGEWIDAGADWSRPLKRPEPRPRAGPDWWSVQPLREVSLPADLPPEWSASPIDRFVYARMAESDLQPAEEADRGTFIRRATFDLLGLPPTPEDVHAFKNDSSPDAHERLIDRLLDSPHYGERWGRHWLDTVRYAESNGFEQNHVRPNAWQYRDYVIKSLNADKPYDRFVQEQLAGDQLAGGPVTAENRDLFIATAFIVGGPVDTVGNGDLEFLRQIRANALDDFIATTGSAFLGLTFNCARCHDHKFDPILQKDYYQLSAIFDGVQHRGRTLETAEESRSRQALLEPLQSELVELERSLVDVELVAKPRVEERREEILSSYRPPVDDRGTEERFESVRARFVRMDIQKTHMGSPMVEEFQVWTSEPGEASRNVALATAGARATAVFTRVSIGDADADLYKIDLAIDGKYGKTWIGSRGDGVGQFTVELAREETISRVYWTKDRNGGFQGRYQGNVPTIYSIQTSLDGESWQEVAHSRDRKPFSKEALEDRLIRTVLDETENQRRAELQDRVAEQKKKIAAVPAAPVLYVASFAQPGEPTYFLKRGNVMDRGETVAPASPSTLASLLPSFELAHDAVEGERRLALARWMTDKRNPLTARVIANRVWHYHFGRGIVSTPSDFGFNGARPTHPELLDYLARRLQDLDWRLKAFHKEIMLSRTYRQSSRFDEANAKIDADAHLLWRFPPRRLEAEAIRDSILAVSGKLDSRMGGEGFRLYRYTVDNVATYYPMTTFGEETYRRAVYHQSARSVKVELLGQYDCPDHSLPAPRRESTISPLQALNLLNNSFTMDQARFFEERLLREVGRGAAMQIRRAYALAFGRSPDSEEERIGRELIEKHGLYVFCRTLLNANEFIYVM